MTQKRQISLFQSILPIIILIILLSYNVYVYGDNALSGSNQLILLIGAIIASGVGFYNGVSYERMLKKIVSNIKTTTAPIIILLFVGALSGTWLLSGVIPAMIYYGLKLLNPSIFLPACVLICIIISLSTGSSWTTSATVGVAMVGVGNALGVPSGITAGAVISGAYFGDKISPLSETTNLAPAMSGVDLFTHIRYMSITTVPSIILAFIIFIFMGLFIDTSGNISDIENILIAIEDVFHITPWLFLIPITILVLIIKKVKPLIAIIISTFMGGIFAIIFQPDLVLISADAVTLNFEAAYKGVLNAMSVRTQIPSDNAILSELFIAKGMSGMLGTVWLILCAMTFGGVLSSIGALKVITKALLNFFNTVFGLFASTVASCLIINVTASDQYLSIVLPGKMFYKSFKNKDLSPENLSRTLEDSGTVTSALVPWNTCGAYQSSVLGVDTLAYLPYAFFNIISPFITLIFAAFKIKLRYLTQKSNPSNAVA